MDVEPYGFIARTRHNGELALTHTPPDVRWLDKLYQTANLQTGVRRKHEVRALNCAFSILSAMVPHDVIVGLLPLNCATTLLAHSTESVSSQR